MELFRDNPYPAQLRNLFDVMQNNLNKADNIEIVFEYKKPEELMEMLTKCFVAEKYGRDIK